MVNNSNERYKKPCLPDQQQIYNVLTANNLCAIRSLLGPLTLRHRQLIVYQTVCNKTLLYHACEHGFRDIAKYLLDECGADIEVGYYDGTEPISPMRLSISKHDIPMMALLMRRRATVRNNNGGISCVHYAFQKKYYSLVSILRLQSERINQPYLDTPHLRGSGFAGVLSRYAGPDFRYIKINMDFLKAAATGNIGSMKTLFASGVNKDFRNYEEENALSMAIFNGQKNAENFLLNYKLFTLKDYAKALELCGAKLIVFRFEKQKGLECWKKSVRIRRDYRIGFLDKKRVKTKMDLGIEFETEKEVDYLRHSNSGKHYIQGLLVFLRLFSRSNRVTQSAFEVAASHYLFDDDLLQPLRILSELYYFPPKNIRPPTKCALHAMEKLFHCRFSSYIEDKTAFLNMFKKLFELLHNRTWQLLLSFSVEFHRAAYEELLALVVTNIDYMSSYDLSKEEKNSIGDEIRTLVDRCSYPYTTTLLHKAIKMKSTLSIVSFIIKNTNDVNCRDALNCTPLHLVARLNKGDPYLYYMTDVLTDAGGHIDCVDCNGKRPLEALKRKGVIDNPQDYLSLQCLAAGVISKAGIFVSEKTFPKILVRFIRLHSKSR